MPEVDIKIQDDQFRFFTGDTVAGNAELSLISPDYPIGNVSLLFICLGEMKVFELPDQSIEAFDESLYREEVFYTSDSENEEKLCIPFSFIIPRNLPSNTISKFGFVRYNIILIINRHQTNEFRFIKEIVVYSPIWRNLMIKVSGTVEKLVLFHGGSVTMRALIDRKGYAQGELIKVHLTVDNRTSAKVTPRVTLRKVEIHMCEYQHKTVEQLITEEPVIGQEISPHANIEEVLVVRIPHNESLSVKSLQYSLKHFIHVTLSIPHSFDLHINLPVVITSKKVVDRLMGNHEELEPISFEDLE